MKSIRWGGVIAFVVIMSLFAAALIFPGGIIKSLMESSFTKIHGAKVDIEAVDVSYSPLTLAIKNIQIADPVQAMVNMAQIGQVKFALSFGQLLLGKVVIDEASINGIQIDTPRRKSGLIEKHDDKDSSKDASNSHGIKILPDLDLPNVKDVLAAEPLLSNKLADQLKEDLSVTETQWNEIKNSLPDKSTLDTYETRFNLIQKNSNGDTKQKLAAIKDAKQLSSDLKIETQRIKQAKDQFNTDIKRIDDEFNALKDAPSKDVERIKNKYNLDNMNAENISQMLFGSQISGYVALAKQWYHRIESYLPEEEVQPPKVERSKGVDVTFYEANPMPDLYVRLAKLTAELPRGNFEGTVTAISSDQSINKQPMRLKLKGIALSNKESEEINGEFNYVDKKNAYSRFNYALVKSKIDNFVVSKSSKLPLTMKKAVMDFNLDAKLLHGSLTGTAKTKFNQVEFDSGNKSSMLTSSFSGVESFTLNGQFNGSINNLSVNVDSNLDNQLGQQLKIKLKEKNLAFEKELKASINEKLKDPMAKIEAKKAKLDEIKNKVDASEELLQQRLAALKDTVSKENDLKKDAIKDKLKKKFGL